MTEIVEGLKSYTIEPEQLTVIKFADNFDATNLDSFNSINGVILWSLIKQRHLATTGFDEKVAAASFLHVEKDYMEFRKSSLLSHLMELTGHNINDAFWLKVHNVLLNPSLFKFIWDGNEYTLNKDTLKLFKAENHI